MMKATRFMQAGSLLTQAYCRFYGATSVIFGQVDTGPFASTPPQENARISVVLKKNQALELILLKLAVCIGRLLVDIGQMPTTATPCPSIGSIGPAHRILPRLSPTTAGFPSISDPMYDKRIGLLPLSLFVSAASEPDLILLRVYFPDRLYGLTIQSTHIVYRQFLYRVLTRHLTVVNHELCQNRSKRDRDSGVMMSEAEFGSVLVVAPSPATRIVIARTVTRCYLKPVAVKPEDALRAAGNGPLLMAIIDNADMKERRSALISELVRQRNLSDDNLPLILLIGDSKTTPDADVAEHIDMIIPKPITPDTLQPLIERLVRPFRRS